MVTLVQNGLKVDLKWSTQSVVQTVTILHQKDFAEGKPALRIARPHVLRALDHLNNALQAKAKAEGKEQANLSFNTAARTEKRAEVCANCHVEYYFAGDLKTSNLPLG